MARSRARRAARPSPTVRAGRVRSPRIDRDPTWTNVQYHAPLTIDLANAKRCGNTPHVTLTPVPVQVHHHGDRGVDGILRLIELASHDGPLETMLTAMCEQAAAIAEVDIASIYVVEDAALVMRGNSGFGAGALGTALGIGEGITGLVAECMRPISAAHAAHEASWKPVPERKS